MSAGARLAPLDVLRALAVILVLFRHHFFTTVLARAGWIGVDLFFVLSGFLISGLLFAELQTRGTISIGRFLARRGFKIYPSFYAFLVVSIVFYKRDVIAATTEAVFLQNYAALIGGRIWYHTWSLAVEEHFYVLLPGVLVLMTRVRPLTLRVVLAMCGTVALGCATLRAANCVGDPTVTFASHYEATHLRMDSLFFGVVLGYLDQYHRKAVAEGVRRHRQALALVATVLVAPPFVLAVENPWMNVVGVSALYVGFGIVLVLALHAVSLPPWVEGSWIGRELLRIGRDSYNIYLWHVFVLEVMAPLWRERTAGVPLVGTGRGDFLIYAVGSIIVGHSATSLIEKPMLRLRDMLVPRRRPSTSTQPAVSPTPAVPQYRALVCITTCRRLENLRRYLPHFARFCAADRRFDLAVALDGTEPNYLRFCEEWAVPLVYSDEREGVGLSKNRVLERYPDFDYYFFLDDDVELVDGSVFPAHVDMARESAIHHFSLFERGAVRKPTGESVICGHRVRHGLFGGGQFNFFTGEGLRRVGGWHPRFAEFRRWGHTEHSYRFRRSDLAPAPFNVAEDLARSCIWHYPPAVTRVDGVLADEDQIAAPEKELIDCGLRHVPLQTLSPHHANGVALGRSELLASSLDAGERYPLVEARQRRQCWSDYHLGRYRQGGGLGRRAAALVAAFWHWPSNPALRHALKVVRSR